MLPQHFGEQPILKRPSRALLKPTSSCSLQLHAYIYSCHMNVIERIL